MADTFSVTGTINDAITIAHTKTQDDGAVATDPLVKAINQTLAYGDGDGQVNGFYHERRTLTTGASQEYDLYGGLENEFGETLNFATIKAIIIHSTLPANKALTVGNGTHPLVGWVGDGADTVIINPGGKLILVAPNTGYTVTADTADDLKITNASGGSSTYDLIILGTV